MQSDTHLRVNTLLDQFYTSDGIAAESIASAVVECVQPRVRELIASEGVKRDDLDDMCQSARLALLRALRSSREPGGQRIQNGVAFARAIARNLLVDAARRERARPQTFSIEERAEHSEVDADSILPPAADNVEATVVSNEWFRARVWPLIYDLLPQHRAALVLGLGQDELLLMAGKIGEVAKAVDIPLREFLELWRDLPLPDRQIAERLGITGAGKTTAVGRVSNLRKCAWERIARHLAKDNRSEDGKT